MDIDLQITQDGRRANKNAIFLWREVLPELQRKGNNLRYVVLEGSSRSGKTFAVAQFLIALCLKPSIVGRENIIIRAYRDDATTSAGTIVEDFLFIMQNNGSRNEKGEYKSLYDICGTWNKTKKQYTFENGSIFHFLGANSPQKAHGKKAYISWLNETMEIKDPVRRQIMGRTENFAICDFNPSLTDHWIFDTVLTNKSWHKYCHSTFKDNIDNLDPKQIYDIASTEPTPENVLNKTANPHYWHVYGEGLRGYVEGQVFPRIHWDVIPDEEFPHISICQRHGYCMDFGFSLDPSSCIECALARDALYLREIIYERGLLIGRNSEDPTIPSIQGRLEDAEISRLTPIICDCADPQNIAYLRACGFNTLPCEKGKDSINYGIQLLKSRRIYIVRSSQNIQREFENYRYKTKPDGTQSDIPEDANNHAIDAIRYWGKKFLLPSNTLQSIVKPKRSKNTQQFY